MLYRYRCTEQQLFFEDAVSYTTYGIILDNDVTTEIQDISTLKSFVDDFVGLLNELQLDPVHLHDVVDDLLA